MEFKILVKSKRKEDKTWHFLKHIKVDAWSDYSALCEAAFQVANSRDPRINQAQIRISATVVLRSQNLSYRFEIQEPSEAAAHQL